MAKHRVDLVVHLLYSPSRWFGWQRDDVRRGGYIAALEGCQEVGQETTVPGALDDLERELRDWIERLDAWADELPHRDPEDRGEGPLSGRIRELLLSGALRGELERVAGEPVLDPAEEPERR